MKRLLAGLGVLLLVVPVTPTLQTANSVVLGVDGGSFTVNGNAKFLVFLSYFDGLDVSDANLAVDFAWLKSKKVDGVRVFPNWWNKFGSTTYYAENPLIKEDGTLDASRLARLRRLLAVANTHGLVVDISLSGENVRRCAGAGCATSSPFVPAGTLTKDELRAGLEALAADLRRTGVTNALVDIQNEADYNSLFVPPSSRATLTGADIKAIAHAIHTIKQDQVVIASFSGGSSAADTAAAAASAGLDAATWHETRKSSWWTTTSESTVVMRGKTTKPIYLQEPKPSDEPGWTLDGAGRNLRAASAAGAAAWTFHTRSSFALNGSSLKSVVASDKSPNDRNFLNQLPALLASISRERPFARFGRFDVSQLPGEVLDQLHFQKPRPHRR